MERYDFHMRLIAASCWALQSMQRLVIDRLPFEFCYELHTVDENQHGIQCGISSEEVVERVWRDGAVPVWIDICVSHVADNKTVFQLLCADRYAEEEKDLYYTWSGSAPFGIKVGNFPPWWNRAFQDGIAPRIKFRLCPTLFNQIADFLLFRWLFCRIDKNIATSLIPQKTRKV